MPPLQSLLWCGQQLLARESDYEQLWGAYETRILSALDRQDVISEAGLARAFHLREARSKWVGWLDRPAVWASLGHFPLPQQRLEDWNRLRLDLECARLVLALRAWHDEHGGWPETLTLLVPSRLSDLPLDPASGQPLVYQRRGASFLVLRHPATVSQDDLDDDDANVLLDSTSPARRLAQWQLSGYESVADRVATGIEALRAKLPTRPQGRDATNHPAQRLRP